MNFPALARTGFAVALSAVLVSMAAPVMAGEQTGSIFSQVAPSLRERMFFRINYIRANVKTSSGDARDVTGPVIATGEIDRLLGANSGFTRPGLSANRNNSLRNTYTNIVAPQFEDALVADSRDPTLACASIASGIGTPCGVRASSQAMVGTPVVSAGYYFDDDFSWAMEAYLLATPLKVEVYGQGSSGLNGQKIIETKFLPPIVVLGKYFGSKDSTVRPFVGFGASYGIFFDVKATDFLNRYEGGSSAGDTTVNLKNTMGVGPFLGLKVEMADSWHVSLNVGKLKYKTEATLTTNNTRITDSSQVLQDLSPQVRQASDAASGALKTGTGADNGIYNLMCDLARARNGSSDCNLGTYVRKQSTVLDSTMFIIAVGRSF